LPSLEQAILGQHRHAAAEAQFPGLYDALVHDATATTLRFTIPAYDGVHVFGPAPYPDQDHPTKVDGTHTHPGETTSGTHSHRDSPTPTPPKGTKCVVGFVGPGIDRPRVLAIYGWPS
jgi:hypothetical protein